MKKLFVIMFSVALAFSTIESCTAAQGGSTSTIGNEIKNSLITYLIQYLSNNTSLSGVMKGVTATTPLTSFLKTNTNIDTFKNLISSKFQIPATKVSNAYSSFGNLTDVANFINKNGSLSGLGLN